jgi:acyl-CoA synthetase (AMP-forming)/AMP-acid ligase II
MDPSYVAELIKKQGVTHVLTSVPSMSREYLAALGSSDDMRLWLMGGESLPPALARDMQEVSK